MLDTSIPLQYRGVDLQQGINNFNTSLAAGRQNQMQRANLQDMAQQRDVRAEQLKSLGLQNAEDTRKASEEKTLRGVFQVDNGGQTPQDQAQILKDMPALGLGHRVTELADFFKKQKYNADKAMLDADLDHHAFFERNIPYVNSQEDLNALIKRSNPEYLKETGMPAVYNQSQFDAFKQHLPATKADLDKQKADLDKTYKTGELTQKQNELSLNKDKLAEEIRNNKDKNNIDRIKATTEKAPKPPTADQGKSALYGHRMAQAVADMDRLESEGYDRTSIKNGLDSKLPNALESSNTQQQNQAERNFVNAVLRNESGAAIAPSEFASAEKQYFKRTGDSKDVIAQKARARQQAIDGFKANAGDAWGRIETISAPQNKTTVKTKSGKTFHIEAE